MLVCVLRGCKKATKELEFKAMKGGGNQKQEEAIAQVRPMVGVQQHVLTMTLTLLSVSKTLRSLRPYNRHQRPASDTNLLSSRLAFMPCGHHRLRSKLHRGSP